jgi:hypothetical protein
MHGYVNKSIQRIHILWRAYGEGVESMDAEEEGL